MKKTFLAVLNAKKNNNKKTEIAIKPGKNFEPRIFFFRVNRNFFNCLHCGDHFRRLIDLTVGNLGSVLSCPQSSTEYLIMATLSKIFTATATYPYQVVRSRLQVTQICYTCFPFDQVYLWAITNCSLVTMGKITKCWGNLVMGDDDESMLHAAFYLVMLGKARDSIASLLFLSTRDEYF